MILLYTVEGGVRTIVFTDTLQTAGMLLGLLVCTVFLLNQLDLSIPQALAQMEARELSTVWHTNWLAHDHFAKQAKPQFAAGALFRIKGLGIKGLPEPRFAG